MKIKRFFSNDMRSVIRKVREELGADAVILSNNKVNGGIEIVAAVDYDESLLPEDNKNTVIAEQEVGVFNNANQNNLNQTQNSTDKSKIPLSTKSVNKYFNDVEDDIVNINQSEHKQLPAINTISNNLIDKSAAKNSDFQFYRLDKGNEENISINASLFDIDNTSAQKSNTKQSLSAKAENVWSQEPTLVSMRNEITDLRGLLEKQLSGLAWGDISRNKPLKAKLLRQLLEIDFSPVLAKEISDSIDDSLDYENAWQNALSYVAERLPIATDDLVVTGGIFAFIGATGVGKTTTIAKLAARYALRHGRDKVALITTDSYRIGAHEQLRTYGRILGIPMRVANNKDELVDILNFFADKQFVLIDTAGMSQRDARLDEQLSIFRDCFDDLKTILVLSSNSHRPALEEIVKNYSKQNIDGCVITKIDETTNLGGALSVICEHNLPITYVCDGQKVPEDIHQARAHSLVNKTVLIARHTNQPMEDELMELAYNRMSANVHM